MRPANITPTELVRIESFANTLDLHADRRADHLNSPGALRRWLLDHRLIDPGTVVGDADLRLARRLRSVMRTMLRAVPTQDETRAAERILARLPLIAALEPDGRIGLRPAGRDVRAGLAEVVAEGVLAHARGTLSRLKICAAEDCQWVYYDAAHNRMGRWCSMGTCGNRAKVRKYRQRHLRDGH
jgi:predicted RNA-binding Zn ribbon-like protein